MAIILKFLYVIGYLMVYNTFVQNVIKISLFSYEFSLLKHSHAQTENLGFDIDIRREIFKYFDVRNSFPELVTPSSKHFV